MLPYGGILLKIDFYKYAGQQRRLSRAGFRLYASLRRQGDYPKTEGTQILFTRILKLAVWFFYFHPTLYE
jgi:hypothetical protein